MIKTGIVSYGFNLPKRRMKVEEVIGVWQNTPLELVKHGFDVQERAVLGVDEDVITYQSRTRCLGIGFANCLADFLDTAVAD